MPVERRAEEPKNGAREGTGDPAQEANSNQGRDNNGRQPVGAKGRSGAAAGSPMRRDDAGNPRTLRRKAMYETLMEQAVADENYAQALAAVKRNQGSAGIDRMTTAQLESHLKANWWILKDKLLKGTYVPSPVKRVEIPKPSGGTRMLGIPTVHSERSEPNR
jgi:RNA-directed DNA polymerase